MGLVMLKTFYVETGELKGAVQAHSWQEAGRIALRNLPLHIQLGSITCVSTTGFDGCQATA